MRLTHLAAAVGAAALALAPLTLTPAAALTAHAAPAHHPATVRTVTRPVTVDGHPAAGYTVKHSFYGQKYGVMCSGAGSASPVAVERRFLFCSPNSADALACYPAAQAHHVYCLMQADRKQLLEYSVKGAIAHTAAPKHPVPLNLKLADGVFCGLRDGGAGSSLTQHPTWYASYYCTRGDAVWAAHGAGIDRDKSAWTVELASDTGKQHVRKVAVTRAWFVGAQH